MALTTVSTTDLYDFVNDISDPEPLALYPSNFTGRMATYLQQLDRIYVPGRNNAGTTVRVGYVDPLFVDGTSPVTNFTQGVGITGIAAFVTGQWNRTLGEQKLYTMDSAAAGGKLQERNPTTLQLEVADPYPNFRNTCTAVGSTEDGYYVSLAIDYIVFEDQGKLYIPHANVRYGGSLLTEVFAEVDLATGLAVPVSGIPGKAATNPNDYQEPEIFGDTVDWMRIQFIEDDDSTHINPKGYLILSEQDGQAGGGAQAAERAYVRLVDWNPNSVSGTPSRVHKRITLTSRIEFDETIVGVGYNNAALVFHPLSGRLYWLANNGFDPSSTGTNILYRFSTTPDLSDITAPAPESTPRTAGTTAFFVEALGTLNEKIPGVSVQYSLEGHSTVLELLDTSAGVGGAAAAVSHIPIDDDEGLEVFEDQSGTLVLLTEGTDYSVNRTTGVITGIAPHWKASTDYYASWNHQTNPSSTSLGTLLLPLVATDSEGKARTRVRYADDDDLVGRFDKLSADTV